MMKRPEPEMNARSQELNEQMQCAAAALGEALQDLLRALQTFEGTVSLLHADESERLAIGTGSPSGAERIAAAAIQRARGR